MLQRHRIQRKGGLGEWILRDASINNNWQSVTFGNGLFVAVANSGSGDRIMTSPDGINWTTRVSAADNFWRSVTFGNGLFVAVANGGTNRIMTSPDGIAWTTRTITGYNWQSVAFGNGVYLTVATSATYDYFGRSTDGGNTWATSQIILQNNIYSNNSVTFGNGFFVAVGNVARSNNNVGGWPSSVSTIGGTTSNSFNSIAYGNGLYVAVGNGKIATSVDKNNWNVLDVQNWHRAIAFGDGLYVATASSGVGNRSVISTDGWSWKTHPTPEDNYWSGIAYGLGRFVAVSNSGTNRVMTLDWNL